jgi:hypothetical protein
MTRRRRPLPRFGSCPFPAAPILLSIVPVVAGSLRLAELAFGPHLLPDNPRINAVPEPEAVHIAARRSSGPSSSRFGCGAVGPGWHRRAGRVLIGGPACSSPVRGSG